MNFETHPFSASKWTYNAIQPTSNMNVDTDFNIENKDSDFGKVCAKMYIEKSVSNYFSKYILQHDIPHANSLLNNGLTPSELSFTFITHKGSDRNKKKFKVDMHSICVKLIELIKHNFNVDTLVLDDGTIGDMKDMLKEEYFYPRNIDQKFSPQFKTYVKYLRNVKTHNINLKRYGPKISDIKMSIQNFIRDNNLVTINK